VAERFPAEQIREHLDEHADAVVRLDLDDPDATDLGIVIEEFDLHPLAVEDAIVDHQRPKLDRYPTHLATTSSAAAIDFAHGQHGATTPPSPRTTR
jgi:magnesium transporter